MRPATCFAALSILCLAGCGRGTDISSNAVKRVPKTFEHAESAVANNAAAVPIKFELERANQADDQAVLVACLDNVIRSKDDLLYNSPDDSDAPEIKVDFADQPDTSPMTVQHLLDSSKPEVWKKLNAIQCNAALEAIGALVKRIKSTGKFTDLSAVDPRIRMDLSNRDFSKEFAGSIVQAYRPGYSTDRQMAYVHMALPWSMHVCFVSYVLQRKGDTWVILLRQEVYYA